MPLSRAYREFLDGWSYQILLWNHSERMLLILQCTFQCMGHTQKCITGAQTFRRRNFVLGAHHKWSETNWLQTPNHLILYWCYGNWLVLIKKGRRWAFRNWGGIGVSPASLELLKRTIRQIITLRRGGGISSSVKKKRKRTHLISATIRFQV